MNYHKIDFVIIDFKKSWNTLKNLFESISQPIDSTPDKLRTIQCSKYIVQFHLEGLQLVKLFSVACNVL